MNRPGDIPGLPHWCHTCGIHLTFNGPCVVCLDVATKKRQTSWTEMFSRGSKA